jgi:hypothetical protein
MLLGKAHAVQYFPRFSIEAVGQFLGVWKCAAYSLDYSLLAAYVKRRTPVAGRKAAFDHDPVADVEPVSWGGGIGRR